MARGPVIPGNRIYSGTQQHMSSQQRVAYRDVVRSAVWISLGLLGIVALPVLLQMVWPRGGPKGALRKVACFCGTCD